jgi:FkbM family methyltransferase
MKTNLIFDIGAFQGEDTKFYLKKGFSVVAIEANPDFAAIIQNKNSEAIRDGLLTVVCAAVSDSNGSAPFFVYEYGPWSSLHDIKSGKPIQILVQSIQPLELFQAYGVPYYLKIDIEGSDIHVIRVLPELGGDIPKYVSFEVGPDVMEALTILSDLGYGRFKLIEQSAVSSMRLPFPPREGRFVEYQFSSANSGPFGEETCGMWMTARQLQSEIQKIDWNATIEVGGEVWNVWYDIHAASQRPA